jgi:hypothetical protein
MPNKRTEAHTHKQTHGKYRTCPNEENILTQKQTKPNQNKDKESPMYVLTTHNEKGQQTP